MAGKPAVPAKKGAKVAPGKGNPFVKGGKKGAKPMPPKKK